MPWATLSSSHTFGSFACFNPLGFGRRFVSALASLNLHPTGKLSLLIAYIKLSPEKTAHAAYVKSLPGKYSTVSTAWRARDIAKLRSVAGVKVYKKALAGRIIVLQNYFEITSTPSMNEAFGETRLDLETWLWASGAVLSRQNKVPFLGGEVLVLTPLWDMMNHSPLKSACVQSSIVVPEGPEGREDGEGEERGSCAAGAGTSEIGNYVLECSFPSGGDSVEYSADQEVFMHYGEGRTTSELLLYSGFVPDGAEGVRETASCRFGIASNNPGEDGGTPSSSPFAKMKAMIAAKNYRGSVREGCIEVEVSSVSKEESKQKLRSLFCFSKIQDKAGLEKAIRGESLLDYFDEDQYKAWLQLWIGQALREHAIRGDDGREEAGSRKPPSSQWVDAAFAANLIRKLRLSKCELLKSFLN